MPEFTQTITIVNKSGKVVSTGKQLLNIFKEAKGAYNEKKAEIRAEHRQRHEEKLALKMLKNQGLIDEARSTTSSRRSHRSSRTHRRDRERDQYDDRRTELTLENLERHSEVASQAGGSRYGSQQPRTTIDYAPPEYDDEPRMGLPRRHTDMVPVQTQNWGLTRTRSDPNLHDEIDMDLAYGYCPPALLSEEEKEDELDELMTKLDKIMCEAQCVQHTATTMIASLQSNPDAMAAVALTLAEISNLVTKMGPSILTTIKGASPAIFALLISPEFLIAGGVAMGVTIVMFGGYKIIKKIQAQKAIQREAASGHLQMQQAMMYEGEFDVSSIDSWRRGVEFDETRSQATSVDAELITPEADRIRKSRRHRKSKSVRAETIVEDDGEQQEDSYVLDDGRSAAPAKSVVSTKTTKSKKSSKDKDKEKSKKQSTLSLLLKRKDTKEKDSSSRRSHRPRMIEV